MTDETGKAGPDQAERVRDLDTEGLASFRAIVSGIVSEGRVPLFHGTQNRFDRFEMIAGMNRSYPNCALGVHVSSDPYTAFDYADYEADDACLILVSAPSGRFGLVGDRAIYIGMSREDLETVARDEPGLIGIVADDLGDDLAGAGVIFDAGSVRIEARIPRHVASADLFDGPVSVICEAVNAAPQWGGAEFVSLDVWGMFGPEP